MTGRRVQQLRRDALSIFEAAVESVDPLRLVTQALPGVLSSTARRVRVIAAGKAAPAMTLAALRVLGRDAERCLVIAPRASLGAGAVSAELADREATMIGAGHPLPDTGSLAAGRAALEMLTDPDAADLLLVLLSGGASSLMCVPAGGISLDDYRAVTSQLLSCGAPIDDINCVRRHIDDIKGGGLARAAAGLPIVALVISDVVGSAPEVIASGPLTGNPTTAADAIAVLERYAILDRAPVPVLHHLTRSMTRTAAVFHSPSDVRLEVIADNRTACRAAFARATDLGYAVELRVEPVTGEASAAGAALAARLPERADDRLDAAGSCLVAGGETTVTLGDSRNEGGRNQELALAAALVMEGRDDCVLLSAGTDGVDGGTDAAGAIVDGGTAGRIRDRRIDPLAALREHDSHRALKASGDLLVTGPTGTNVMDLQLILHRNPGLPAS